MSLKTIKRLPRFLRSIPFWKDLIEVCDEELTLFKEQKIDIKKDIFNPRVLNTIDDLRALNNFFGFIVDVSLLNEKYETEDDEIIRYLRREAENMVLKVRSKGTSEYHRYIFHRIAEPGYVYVLFHSEQANRGTFYRSLNFYDDENPKIQEQLIEHDFTYGPFVETTPLYPFAEGFLILYGLDRDLTLDEGWTLDYSLFGADVSLTKHINVEFMARKTFEVGSDTRLITDVHLEYLRKSIVFGKRAVEVPHAGIGVTSYCKTDEAIFTIPDINVSQNITASWLAGEGTPDTTLYNYYKVGNDSVKFFEQDILSAQIYTDEFFDILNITFPGNKIFPEVVGTGDGTNTTFNFTLDYPGVDPHTFKLVYKDVNDEERIIVDDGYGNLFYPEFYSIEDLESGNVDLTDFKCGEINYTTGQANIETIDTRPSPIPNIMPANTEDLISQYFSLFGHIIDEIEIFNNADNKVIHIEFPDILIRKKDYHISFMIVVDRRI